MPRPFSMDSGILAVRMVAGEMQRGAAAKQCGVRFCQQCAGVASSCSSAGLSRRRWKESAGAAILDRHAGKMPGSVDGKRNHAVSQIREPLSKGNHAEKYPRWRDG